MQKSRTGENRDKAFLEYAQIALSVEETPCLVVLMTIIAPLLDLCVHVVMCVVSFVSV